MISCFSFIIIYLKYYDKKILKNFDILVDSRQLIWYNKDRKEVKRSGVYNRRSSNRNNNQSNNSRTQEHTRDVLQTQRAPLERVTLDTPGRETSPTFKTIITQKTPSIQ